MSNISLSHYEAANGKVNWRRGLIPKERGAEWLVKDAVGLGLLEWFMHCYNHLEGFTNSGGRLTRKIDFRWTNSMLMECFYENGEISKSMVVWLFEELDSNADGVLRDDTNAA